MAKETSNRLGARVRRYRFLHDLTQAELARRWGFSALTIWRVENGIKISARTEFKIRRALQEALG